MHLPSIFTTATLMAAASAIRVSYDPGYDEAARSLTVVSCSDGVNGLITRYGWKTQGNVAGFSSIGGAQAVSGYNSPNCGTCWRLQYKSNTIFVLAIDHTDTGFNIAKGALDRLTNNHAVEFGWVDATATQVDVKNCGITNPH